MSEYRKNLSPVERVQLLLFLTRLGLTIYTMIDDSRHILNAIYSLIIRHNHIWIIATTEQGLSSAGQVEVSYLFRIWADWNIVQANKHKFAAFSFDLLLPLWKPQLLTSQTAAQGIKKLHILWINFFIYLPVHTPYPILQHNT